MARIDENLEGACLVPDSDLRRLHAIWAGEVKLRDADYYEAHHGAHHPSRAARALEGLEKRAAHLNAAHRLRGVPVDGRTVEESQFLLRAKQRGLIPDCGYAPAARGALTP
jgi:hypothetical protein